MTTSASRIHISRAELINSRVKYFSRGLNYSTLTIEKGDKLVSFTSGVNGIIV
jgi:hypothetical protein